MVRGILIRSPVRWSGLTTISDKLLEPLLPQKIFKAYGVFEVFECVPPAKILRHMRFLKIFEKI